MLHAQGPLLTIDVGDRETAETDVDDVLEQFIGGRGAGTKLAHERIPFDADPLGPENSLFFATGPLQVSETSFTGRMSCTGLSPLTDGLLSANAGGFISRPFADTGNAVVEITGQSDELVGIHVTDEGVEFEAVPELGEATVYEVTDHVEESRGLDAEHIAAIGPAGENEVRFACIINTESRAWGRGGLGAVLGSKNVKFVTFDGDSPPEIDIDEEVAAEIREQAATSDSPMKETGTVSVTDYANAVGALPTRYFRDLQFEDAEDIGPTAVAEHKYQKGTCSQCAFACKLPTKDEESGLETEGPEYETVMSFGSNADNDDFVAIMEANDLCDRYGMDTISCGDAVSAYLAAEDEFGNTDLMHDVIEKIAYREGVGDTLAEGIDRCHDELGVENWTVKGMEFSAHDGRALNGQGLSFAVANRGGDHMYAEMYQLEYPLVGPEDALDSEGTLGKADVLVDKENHNALKDSGVMCKFAFGEVTEDQIAALLDADWEELDAVGARTVELERHFNNQRGFDRSDDNDLPYDLPDMEQALEEYYAARGWNDDGTVPDSKVGGGAAASADD